MDKHQRKAGGESVSPSTALSKFTDLFESFANELLAWRDSISTGLESKWKEYFGAESPSLAREIDETSLVVLERHLKMLTLLMETRLEELTPGNDETSITSEKAADFRTEAEVKLMELYDRLKRIKARLQSGEDSGKAGNSQSPYSLDLITERKEVSRKDSSAGKPRAQSLQPAGTLETTKPEPVDSSQNEPTSDPSATTIEPQLPAQEVENGTFDKTSPVERSGENVTSGIAEESFDSEEEDSVDTDEPADSVSGPNEVDVSSDVSQAAMTLDPIVEAEKEAEQHDNSDQNKTQNEVVQATAEPELTETVEEAGPLENDTEQTVSFVEDSELERQDPGLESAAVLQKEIDMLASQLLAFKKVHTDKNDLKVKSSSGSWTLSLPYYLVGNGSGKTAAMLDLENFIRIHKLAVKGVLDTAAKSEDPDNDPKMKTLVLKLQEYLTNLYFNIHKIIAPQGERFLPETGEMIDSDVFLMLETDLNLFEWQKIEDVVQFQNAFIDKIAQPFQKYISIPENKVNYLKSIIEYGNH